jgi:hypothetical protein
MTLENCRKSLIGIWGLGFLIPCLLIFAQAVGGKYGGKFAEVLGWLTALTLPTILLMIGVMVANPAGAVSEDKKTENEKNALEHPAAVTDKAITGHESFIFRLAVTVSLIYFLIINLVFFIEPFSALKPQDLMRDYKIFLAGFDSLISLLIGYFFGKK